MKRLEDMCKCAVAFIIDGKNYDDGKSRASVTAIFDYPAMAEKFIKKCLPDDARNKFFMIDVDDLNDCEDYEKIKRDGIYAYIEN